MMKMFQAVFLSIVVSAAAHATPSSFEGRIDLLTTEGRKTFTTTFYYTAAKMRIETSEGGEAGAMIMDLAKKEILMLMPSEKMYMVMNIGEQMERPADNSPPPVKTGRTETILGYECVEYTVTGKKTVTEYWAAKGLGVFRAMARGGPGGPPTGLSTWESEAAREGLFPLRTVERNVKGKELSRTEATAITPGSQPASLFVPPKDFQKFEMPSLGKMFGN